MDFTSNFRVSSSTLSTLHFDNKNSNFRVIIPTNDIFGSEKSKLSIAIITYQNRFKILLKYLESNIIRKIYLYSDHHVNEFIINSFMGDDHELSVDISNDVSLDPVSLITNH